MNVNEEESGMYMGVLNIFVVIPQILVALGIGFLLRAAGGNFAIALACGGASALICKYLLPIAFWGFHQFTLCNNLDEGNEFCLFFKNLDFWNFLCV